MKINRPIPSSQIKLLVFDLDGTLIDSRQDLVNSVNAALRFLERPELPSEVIASLVGDGAPVLIQRALGDFSSGNPSHNHPIDESLVNRGLEFFLSYYREHKLDYTKLYDGTEAMLNALEHCNGSRREMAVLSNKPVVPSRAIVDALGIARFFRSVYGGNSFVTKKPDPLGLQTILQEAGVRPEECVMIGDSAVDILTGQNAGTRTLAVSFGFAPHTLSEVHPDIIVESPSEITEALHA